MWINNFSYRITKWFFLSKNVSNFYIWVNCLVYLEIYHILSFPSHHLLLLKTLHIITYKKIEFKWVIIVCFNSVVLCLSEWDLSSLRCIQLTVPRTTGVRCARVFGDLCPLSVFFLGFTRPVAPPLWMFSRCMAEIEKHKGTEWPVLM